MEITVEPYAVLQRQQKERLPCLLIEHPTDHIASTMGVIYHLGIRGCGVADGIPFMPKEYTCREQHWRLYFLRV